MKFASNTSLLALLSIATIAATHAGSTAGFPFIGGSITSEGVTEEFIGEVTYDPIGDNRTIGTADAKKPGDFGGVVAGAYSDPNKVLEIDGDMSGNVDPLMFFSGHAVNGTLSAATFSYTFAAPIVIPPGTVSLAVSLSFGESLSDGLGDGSSATPLGSSTAFGRLNGIDLVGVGGPVAIAATGSPSTTSFSFPTASILVPYTGQSSMGITVKFHLDAASSLGFSGTLLVLPSSKPVPDAGTSVTLLGLAVAGLAAVRRQTA
jgi:VPDSG-CTERM motif